MSTHGNLLKIQIETVDQKLYEDHNQFLRMPRHRIISELILKYCKTDCNIADIGSGKHCDQLRYLKSKRFEKLTGVDFHINHDLEAINIVESDIEESLPLEQNKFEAVILADVMEHVRWPRFLLKNVLKTLKNDGLLFVSIPNAGHFYNGILLTLFPRHLNMSSAFGPWGHYYFFTYYDFKKVVDLFGLELVEFKSSDLEFKYMGMRWIKRLAMWLLNLIPIALNFGFMRRYFSDHFYFVLRKKNDNYLNLNDNLIFEANV